jgi:hypothetical protein
MKSRVKEKQIADDLPSKPVEAAPATVSVGASASSGMGSAPAMQHAV